MNAVFFLIVSALMFFAVSALMFFAPPPSLSADPETPQVRKLQETIARLKAANEANRRKMEEVEKKLEQLASKSEEGQKERASSR
jgi:septal ring factor EnvC (AmiA/AmiB activator)